VSDAQHPSGGSPDEHGPSGWVVIGIVLVVAGFFLGARNLGIMPWPFDMAWETLVRARTGVGVILVGILFIVWAQSGRLHSFNAPERGRKLYRSREDKWLAGVLGGLADYFGIDATMIRLAFVVLVVLFDVGVLVVAYIVMAILVPVEPVAGTSPAVVPTAPAPAAPPAPVEPPAPAPEAPAASAPEGEPAAESSSGDPTTWA